jgi:hypothetical protein
VILAKDLQYLNNEIAQDQIEKINSIKSKIYKLKQVLVKQ